MKIFRLSLIFPLFLAVLCFSIFSRWFRFKYIFTSDELGGEELFDKNVIVDLSRVGSTETKSLIMGLLVMKLNEYRMTYSGDSERPDKITVTVTADGKYTVYKFDNNLDGSLRDE